MPHRLSCDVINLHSSVLQTLDPTDRAVRRGSATDLLAGIVGSKSRRRAWICLLKALCVVR